jgi:hypothetical protein
MGVHHFWTKVKKAKGGTQRLARGRQKPLHINIVRRNQSLQIGPQRFCLAASIREREMKCPITINSLPIYCFLCCPRRRNRTIGITILPGRNYCNTYLF